MSIAAFITVAVIIVCLALLISTNLPPDLVLFGGLIFMVVGQVIPPAEALTGFANQGMLTVAVLYIVAAGLQETGAIQNVTNYIMGRPKHIMTAQRRIMSPVMVLSAFMNNTPVVASFIPALQDWARRNGFSASKLLIPLSYAAILGGTCTLIGTSTNLIVNGLLIEEPTTGAMNIFTPALIGIPVSIVGFIYIITVGRRLIPDRSAGFETFDDPKEYTIEMEVASDGPLVDKTIEEAGLRGVPNVFLIDIYRQGEIISAATPRRRLSAGDRLIFVGMVDSVRDLQQINGLRTTSDLVFGLDTPRQETQLVEAVVSPASPMVGMTIKESNFRKRYDAFVIAVARNGERIRKKVGDIILKAGDILLLEAPQVFAEQEQHSRDWYLISPFSNYTKPRFDKAWMAWSILGGMVLLAALDILSMFEAGVLASGAMLLTGVIDVDTARRSVDLQVLLVIASALGIGNALEYTGAASAIAAQAMDLVGTNPYMALVVTYVITAVMTELITNNAAAVLVFPIALSVAQSFDASVMPFAITIMMAASASFATPLGYQTNLMVYGPGGYKFTDFMKVGLPLSFLVFIVVISLVPLIWPL